MTARLTFPRARRLTLASEFAKVKAEGKAVHGRLLTLGCLSVDDCPRFRAGIVVSKRIGQASVRNSVRRKLRAIIRIEQKKVTDGLWLVLIARSPSAGAPFSTLRDEWLRLAERASILAP